MAFIITGYNASADGFCYYSPQSKFPQAVVELEKWSKDMHYVANNHGEFLVTTGVEPNFEECKHCFSLEVQQFNPLKPTNLPNVVQW